MAAKFFTSKVFISFVSSADGHVCAARLYTPSSPEFVLLWLEHKLGNRCCFAIPDNQEEKTLKFQVFTLVVWALCFCRMHHCDSCAKLFVEVLTSVFSLYVLLEKFVRYLLRHK